jgi:hypothetical protein
MSDTVDVASWKDVERIAAALPQVEERLSHGRRQWRVRDKLFVWERPLRPKEAAEVGPGLADGPILGARVEHLIAKDALLADDARVYFTTSHFDGYPAVLARIDRIGIADLEELVTEAWLARAPKRLVEAYLTDRSR